MAGSIVQIVGPGGAATAATTVVSSSITVTAGNTLWVLAISDDATISSCTDSISGSNTYTERGSVIEAAILRRLHHLTAPITVGGTGTVTVTFGASVSNRQIWLIELTGVSSYLNQGTATDTGNNPTDAASATNASQPFFAIAALVDYQGGSPTVRNINGAAATSGGALAAGGQLGGIVEYTAGLTTTGTNTADFNNTSFSRTCTVFALFDEVSNISFALTGVQATGQVGSLGALKDPATSFQQFGFQSNAFAILGGTAGSSPDVSKALTGVSATGQVGTIVSNVSYAITGNQATGQVGTVTGAAAYALTGNSATGQVGTVVSNITYGLTGVQATGQVGTVSYASDITLALTGVSATGSVGTLVPNVSYALTGNQATGQVGTVTSAVSYALTGIAATGNVGAVISNITYGLTGNQATGQVGTVSAGNDVTFALTGVQATGNVGAVTPNITYALTGVQASGQVGAVTASPSYGITGNQATGQVGTLTSAVAYGLIGVQGSGQIGSVSVPGDVTIALTGVQATGQIGSVIVFTDAPFDYHDGGKEKKRRKRELDRIEEERLKRERLRAQIESLVSPPESVDSKPDQETAPQVFKESEKPVILPPLPEADEDEEDILRLLMSYYEIPRRILP